MRLVNGQPVADSYYEYGIRYQSGDVADCDDEGTARLEAEFYHAEVVRHRVYVMEWEKSPEAESSASVPGNAQGDVPGLD
jgi:hypothetical protein